MKRTLFYIIGLATLLALSGMASGYAIAPEAVGAGHAEPRRKLDFDEETHMYLAIPDSTPAGGSFMLWDAWGGTWSDAEKVPGDDGPGNPPPDNPGEEDDFMCWAAAASNVLEWTGWGLVSGMSNTDQMFQHFQDHWYDEGSLPSYAWNWWFDGTLPPLGGSYVDVPSGGSFWPTYVFADYYIEQWTRSNALPAIAADLSDGFGVTLAIYKDTGGGHALTCWGYNFDSSDPDYYVGIWVTDSDDDKHLPTPPDRLRYYEVAYDSGGSRWHLQSFYGSDSWYIGGVMALRLAPAADMHVSIYTDKETYHAGETMFLGLDAANTRSVKHVCFAIWCELPDSSLYVLMHEHSVVLPSGFSYANPSFEIFILPALPPGTYTWHAAFLERATHEIIVEDTAEWEFS